MGPYCQSVFNDHTDSFLLCCIDIEVLGERSLERGDRGRAGHFPNKMGTCHSVLWRLLLGIQKNPGKHHPTGVCKQGRVRASRSGHLLEGAGPFPVMEVSRGTPNAAQE